MNERGYYGKTEVSYDISPFPGGIYIYQIETSEFRDAKKLIISKK
jgi:hypothetical protein